MSEEIILGGAFFDNSMPKWATEETIKRLGLEFKKDRSVSKKQQDTTIALLKKMLQVSTKDEKGTKEQTKELKSIVKELKASNKSNAALVKELKDQNKELKEIRKVSGKASNNNSVINGASSKEAKKTNDWLEKIHHQMSQMTRASSKTPSAYRDKSSGGEVSQAQTRLRQSDSTTRNGQRKTQQRLAELSETISSRMSAERGDSRSRLSRMDAGNAGRGGKTARALQSIGKVTSALTGFGKKLTSVITGIWKFAKNIIPGLGTLATAVTAAVGVFDVIINSHDDYKRMLDAGFTFMRDTAHKTGSDGIYLRKIISNAGFTIEAGMEVMARNAHLFNELSGQVFEDFKAVAGDAFNAASFANRMLMDRDQVLKMSADYLSTLKSIGDLERLNQKERNASIRTFIHSTVNFSKVTGKSIKEIEEIMNGVHKQANVRAYTSKFDGETRQEMRNTLGQWSSLGGPIGELMVNAIASPGSSSLGLMARPEEGQELYRLFSMIEGGNEMWAALTDHVKNFGTRHSSEDMASVLELMKEVMGDAGPRARQGLDMQLERLVNKDGRQYMGLAEMNSLNLDIIKLLKSGKNYEAATETSDTGNKREGLRKSSAASLAAREAVSANVADTEVLREAANAVFGVGISANELIAKAAQGTSSAVTTYLPQIRDLLIESVGGVDELNEKAKKTLTKNLDADVPETFKSNILKQFSELGLRTDLGASSESERFDNRRELYRQYEQQSAMLADKGLDAESLKQKILNSTGEDREQAIATMVTLASKHSHGVTTKKMRNEFREAIDEVVNESTDSATMAATFAKSSGAESLVRTMLTIQKTIAEGKLSAANKGSKAPSETFNYVLKKSEHEDTEDNKGDQRNDSPRSQEKQNNPQSSIDNEQAASTVSLGNEQNINTTLMNSSENLLGQVLEQMNQQTQLSSQHLEEIRKIRRGNGTTKTSLNPRLGGL